MDERILFDEEDRELVESRKWRVFKSHGKEYVRAGHETLHRTIMGWPEGLEVDHVNGNGLDNRKANLRLATKSQNRANKSKYSNNTSGYKGVMFEKKRNKWRARLHFENKIYGLGRYQTAEEAALAYNEAAIKIHGEFAKLNIITK